VAPTQPPKPARSNSSGAGVGHLATLFLRWSLSTPGGGFEFLVAVAVVVGVQGDSGGDELVYEAERADLDAGATQRSVLHAAFSFVSSLKVIRLSGAGSATVLGAAITLIRVSSAALSAPQAGRTSRRPGRRSMRRQERAEWCAVEVSRPPATA
jgi:hypothetical protein